MNPAVFRQTLADARRILLALCVGLGAISAIDAAVFPSFARQAALVERLIPSFFRMMFSRVPMDNPDGFMSWALKHPLWVALALTWPIGTAGAAFAGEI
ncbi:MAG: hypothetical protein KGR26_00205, partial [Cyanobacteria bacterium REEB65]|nr:hypothetical protein [Cyanobacteria bacterium REEB65]